MKKASKAHSDRIIVNSHRRQAILTHEHPAWRGALAHHLWRIFLHIWHHLPLTYFCTLEAVLAAKHASCLHSAAQNFKVTLRQSMQPARFRFRISNRLPFIPSCRQRLSFFFSHTATFHLSSPLHPFLQLCYTSQLSTSSLFNSL